MQAVWDCVDRSARQLGVAQESRREMARNAQFRVSPVATVAEVQANGEAWKKQK